MEVAVINVHVMDDSHLKVSKIAKFSWEML